jgi:hypothetical protein
MPCAFSGLRPTEAPLAATGGVAVQPEVPTDGVAPAAEVGLAQAIEGNECAAYRSLFAVARAVHGRGSFEVAEQGTGTLFMSALMRQPGVFNRALGFGLPQQLSARESRQIERVYAARGLGVALEIEPPRLSAEASSELRALGLRRGALAAMVVRRQPWASVLGALPRARSDLRGASAVPRAVKAESTTERAAAAALCARVFAVGENIGSVLQALDPAAGWHHWLAYVGDQPAGAALSFIAEGRCWLGWAATLREFRSRGVKGALDDLRLTHAAAAGCRFISSDTAAGTAAHPDHSLRSLRRRGFEVAYQRATYLRLAPLAADESERVGARK